MIGKITGNDTPAVGVSMGFEPICMLIKEKGINFSELSNLALIYDNDDNIIEVFKAKEKLKKKYNVSLFLRPKNMKSFYEKVSEVANFVTTYKDYTEGKEVKVLNN